MQGKFNNVITFQQKNSNHQIEEIGGTLVEVFTSGNFRTPSKETTIVTETQDNDRINSFLVNSPFQ